MIKFCKRKNCERCNGSDNCDGKGICFSKIAKDEYIQHVCEYECELIKCLKCREQCAETTLDLYSGFCMNCHLKLCSIYEELFEDEQIYIDDKRIYARFIDSLVDLYEWKNKIFT